MSATTTEDQVDQDEENNSNGSSEEDEEETGEEVDEENDIEREGNAVDEADGETSTDGEDEHVIPPTRRIIPPFSWEQEVQKAQTYLHSFTNVGRTSSPQQPKKNYHDALLFFHIPKTAGTAIESAAGTNPGRPLAWGSCRFNHTPKREVCHYPENSKVCTYFVFVIRRFPFSNG